VIPPPIYAIAKGIKANANILFVLCCHKQIRKQTPTKCSLKPTIQHGILIEPVAEMVTDTICALRDSFAKQKSLILLKKKTHQKMYY
jgi:hypothetical protein